MPLMSDTMSSTGDEAFSGLISDAIDFWNLV